MTLNELLYAGYGRATMVEAMDQSADAQAFIEAFDDAYEASGLATKGHMSLYAFGPKVEISHIGTNADHRGEGVASKAMELVCNLADERGIVLFLSPADDADGEDGLPDREQLANWYEGFGFEHRGQGRMIRMPYEIDR